MIRVLVVEDEFLLRQLVVEELQDAGLEVESARDSSEAMAIMEKGTPFDVLFTDIRMPGEMDGWTLGRTAAELFPNLRVIYATGYAKQVVALCGHEGFMRKPYRTAEILNMMNGLGVKV